MNLQDLISQSGRINSAFYDQLKRNLSKGIYLGRGIRPAEFYLNGYRIPPEEPIYISHEVRTQHFGCLGTTGCGKTTMMRLMILQDILLGNNVLIIDPKCDEELLNTVVEAAIYAGRLNELLFVSPIYPDLSLKINLLQYFMIPDELVDHIVSGVWAREPYFINVAQEVSTAIIKGLLLLAKARGQEATLNFAEVKRWCSHHALGDLRSAIQYYKSHSDPEIREDAREIDLILEQILQSPQDFFAKVSSSLRTVLTALSSSTTGKIIGKAQTNEFIRRLEAGERVILFCNTGSLLARRTANIIARIIISMVQACLGRLLSQGKKFDPPLSIYMDEGHNVLYLGIQELFNKGRGANTMIHLFTQSYAQMEEAVGPDAAKAISDNISTWVFMRLNHEQSAKVVEDTSPEITKKTAVHNMTDGVYEPLLRDDSDKLIKSTYVLNLPNRNFYLRVKGTYWRGELAEISPAGVRVILPERQEPEEIVEEAA